jgi:hypothetical protein
LPERTARAARKPHGGFIALRFCLAATFLIFQSPLGDAAGFAAVLLRRPRSSMQGSCRRFLLATDLLRCRRCYGVLRAALRSAGVLQSKSDFSL